MKKAINFLFILFFTYGFALPVLAQPEEEEYDDDPVIRDLIYTYSRRAFDYFQSDINLDSAEYYYKQAIDLAYKSHYEINFRVAINHTMLASLYRTIHNNGEALKHLNKAEDILNETDSTHYFFVYIYHNKGNIYRVQEDFFRTKEYYEYALDFFLRYGYQNTNEFTFVYSNYIGLLLELEEYELAEEKFSMIDLNNLNVSPLVNFRIRTTNGSLYSKMGKFDLALEQFEKAQNDLLYNPSLKENSRDVLNFYYELIGYYMLSEEYDLALTQCNKAYVYIESLDARAAKSKVVYNTDIAFRAAGINYLNGDLEKARWLVDNSIEELNNFIKNISDENSTDFRTNELSTALPDLYVLKSRILFEVFKGSNEFDDLVNSYDAYQIAIETLNYMKLAMSDENSRIFATSRILEVYKEAVYIGKMLFDLTGDMQYLEQSFEFGETSKSFALYSEIKDLEAMQFSDLPEDIKEREKRLMGEIQAYEELLYQEQISTEPDSSNMAFYKETLFHLKDDYDELIYEIEQNYANYYEFKYEPKFVSLEEVKDKLAYKDALIEYVLSDSLLITYVVDRKRINVFSQNIEPEFADECLEYYQLLNGQNFSRGVHENYRRFVELGNKFYKILVEPCLQYTDRKNFTIIPDGAITYIPFEGLITKDTDTEYINYLKLPYLIREYSVGYSHSSTLLFTERYKTKSPEDRVLAFAPEYEDPFENMDAGQIRQFDENLEYFFPLVGTIKEVQSINETVPSRVFINEKATEANFKKYASDYNVLHLAMHTIMRDDQPVYSLLAFSNVDHSDSIEDNKLFAYEIYNMKLNAQMAVLSSCSSGFGKMQKGEGMMSLARSFIYAGCPSIVMTLWQVADKSSSELMTSFYKYLKKGKSKQEAMRLAKIDYLDSSDDLTSNPYFWSGFVVLGDGSPIYKKSGFVYWAIFIALFAIISVILQYRRTGKRKHY